MRLRVRLRASIDSRVLSHSNESGTKKFASPLKVGVTDIGKRQRVRFKVRSGLGIRTMSRTLLRVGKGLAFSLGGRQPSVVALE